MSIPFQITGGGSSANVVGSIAQFNPAADGTTDDSAVFTTAQGTYNEIWLTPSKQYAIGTNLSLTASLRFPAGSQLVVKTGVTLTLSGNIEAPLNQIFVTQGTGKVVFGTKNAQYDVFPEWWGAVGNNSTDDTVAIQAAINAVSGAGLGYMSTESSTPPSAYGCVVLGTKVYKLTAGLTIQASNVAVRGQSQRGSILMQTSASADTLTIAGTGSGNTQAVCFVRLSDFGVMRNVAPTGTPAGFLWKNALVCYGERLESWDSIRGYSLAVGGGIAHLQLYDCYAQGGNQTGTNTGGTAAGFYVGGTCSSSRLTNCVVTSNGDGFYFVNASDVFCDRCETATAGTGFNIAGGCIDLIFYGSIVEGGGHSIFVNTNTAGKIQFTNGYYHGSGGGSGTIAIHASAYVSIIGGDVSVLTGANGVYVDGASFACLVQGLNLKVTTGTSTAGPMAIAGPSATNITFANNVIYAPVGNPGLFAIYLLSGATHCNIVGNMICGYFGTGIQLDSGNNNNAVIGNVIDPTHVTTPILDNGTGNTKLNQTT